MKSLGIELKGNTCIGVITDTSAAVLETLKIELTDSYEQNSIKDFYTKLQTVFNEQKPDAVVIKKRNEKGKFAGGPVSFKMEGLIQLAAQQDISFLTGAQLNAYAKKITDLPEVKKYQSQALICAMFGLNI